MLSNVSCFQTSSETDKSGNLVHHQCARCTTVHDELRLTDALKKIMHPSILFLLLALL